MTKLQEEIMEFLKQVITGDLEYVVVDDEVTGIPDYIKCEVPVDLKQKARDLLTRLIKGGYQIHYDIHRAEGAGRELAVRDHRQYFQARPGGGTGGDS